MKIRGDIMNPFIQHPHQQGVTYMQHMAFALSIAARLMQTVTVFTLHAIFPFMDINRSLDLEATEEFIHMKNGWIEDMKSAGGGFENVYEGDVRETY